MCDVHPLEQEIEPKLEKKIKQNWNLADLQQTEEGPCLKDDLQITSLQEVETNFNEFILSTQDIIEDPLLFKQYEQLFKFDMKTWPNQEQAQILFKNNVADTRKRCKKWSDIDKKLFHWVVIRYCLKKQILSRIIIMKDWREIAKLIIGRNAHQCKNKWQLQIRVLLTQAPWTKKEDEVLIKLHKEFTVLGKQNKWSQLSKAIQLTLKSCIQRQPKQCRERWINKLNPDIQDIPWTREQELSMLRKIAVQGKKWTELSKHFNDQRSENILKSRFQHLIKYEKSVFKLDKIDPQLFQQIQQIRTNCIFQKDIDHHEWQYIILAIQRLERELNIHPDVKIETCPHIASTNPFEFAPFPFSKQFVLPKFRLFNTKTMKMVDQSISLEKLTQTIEQTKFQTLSRTQTATINQSGSQSFSRFLLQSHQMHPNLISQPIQEQLLHQSQISMLISAQSILQQGQMYLNNDYMEQQFLSQQYRSINSSIEQQILSKNYQQLGENLYQFTHQQNQNAHTGIGDIKIKLELDQMFLKTGIPFFEDSEHDGHMIQEQEKQV